jgi:integrase
MPYHSVREPLTAEEADRLANGSETPTEQLIVWTLLDTGLRISELCNLTSKDVLWQQRQLRVRGKGGPYGKKSKVRVVPMSRRVRALLEHHFALHKEFPVRGATGPGPGQAGRQGGVLGCARSAQPAPIHAGRRTGDVSDVAQY